jgi:hypothetical protein
LQEGHTGITELEAAGETTSDLGDDDPRAVKLMINYLYLHVYDPRTALVPIPPTVTGDRDVEESTEHAAEVVQAAEHQQGGSSRCVLESETAA